MIVNLVIVLIVISTMLVTIAVTQVAAVALAPTAIHWLHSWEYCIEVWSEHELIQQK